MMAEKKPRSRRQRRAWGSIIPKKNGIFVAYTGPDMRRHTAGRSFVARVDAEAWLASERRLISMDMWTPPAERRQQQRGDNMTVADLITAHETELEEQGKHKDSTIQSYKRTTTNRILEVDGPAAKLRTIPLAYLNDEHVAQWWRAINRQYPNTQTTNRSAYVRLRAAGTWGVEQKTIPLAANPVYIKDATAKPETKPKQLATSAELRAIIDELPDRYKALGVLCLFHGLRIGEALALQRRDVSLSENSGEVSVRGNLQRIATASGRNEMVWQAPKTEAGARTVPVFPVFVPILRRHLDEFTGRGGKEWFTATESGAPVFDTSFRSIFARARKAAGVRSEITPHYGRNYLITLLAERGATPAEIGAILGQQDVATIIGVYMKARESRKRALMSTPDFEGE